MATKLVLLVGDNPFHGVSHLSQERTRLRDDAVLRPDYAAGLVSIAIENGAEGFFFSVSDTTLEICKLLGQTRRNNPVELYAMVPYAYEIVRSSVYAGGLPRVARTVAKQVVLSKNLKSVGNGLLGIIRAHPLAMFKAYLHYEVSKIKSCLQSSDRNTQLKSVLLHEAATDIGLALNTAWLFKAHIEAMLGLGIKPGFCTRNFPHLLEKFEGWGIDVGTAVIAASFNSIGFQMCPSKAVCEEALSRVNGAEVIAFSILAAGCVRPEEAAEYITTLPNLSGVVVGVSKDHHAMETFQILNTKLRNVA
jgi:hypothetical protein